MNDRSYEDWENAPRNMVSIHMVHAYVLYFAALNSWKEQTLKRAFLGQQRRFGIETNNDKETT